MQKHPPTNYRHFDVIIIGSGGSGLTAAIYAAKNNLKAAVISKVHPMQSHTVAAQGGINAALGNVTEDNPRWHMYDTIKASDWLADQDSVEQMCQRGKESIEWLESIGVHFNLTPSGTIDQKTYGGQSTHYGEGELAYRACYSTDRTGQSIMEKLYKVALEHDISFFNYNFALDLLMDNNECLGVVTWDIENGAINVIHAPHTIIATGGSSQIYGTSTSSSICTGDGNGLAVRAGINLQDMEFTQFHPTAINKIGVLITEAARSAGATLKNNKGERFMAKYAPKFLELASRDVIARSIATEIMKGKGCGPEKDHVLLDLTHLTVEQIKTNLPTVFENCETFLKLDPSKFPIPVAPAAHYSMGGIPTDNSCRVVKPEGLEYPVKGLYAIGEAASISVHGASRLGCNSLLDLVVFARVSVESILKKQHITVNNYSKIAPLAAPYITKFFAILTKPQGSVSVGKLRDRLKTLMQKNVGVFRSRQSLATALQLIEIIKEDFSCAGTCDKDLTWNKDLQEYLELGNMFISAESAIACALWREESRGAHWREDFPNRNDKNFLFHTIYVAEEKKCLRRNIRQSTNPVHFFQPEKRLY